MKKLLIYLCFFMLFLSGCIYNDLPYPIVVPHITSMTVQDAVDVDIDHENRIVTVYVSETTDLRTVVVQSVEFDQDIAVPSISLTGVHDLRSPLKFKITTYQDYLWTIKAERHIERYFNIVGQIGGTVIDEHNCRVIVTVPEGADVSNLTVSSFKLGPVDITEYSKEASQMRDFSSGQTLDVTAFGETRTWTVYVEETDMTVMIEKVNPWTKSAYVTAMGIAGRDVRFQYRSAGTEEWQEVSAEDVIIDGGTFVAHIKGLQPSATYETVVWCGQDMSLTESFTTAPATPLPNGSFEYASLVKGSNFYKFYDPDCGVEEGETMFWGSGNGLGSEGNESEKGSGSMGIIITTIDKENKIDGNQSVCAETKEMVGILAAGNLFTGNFAGLVGTSGGMVNFGRPWTTRPVALKLWCRYVTSNINIIKDLPSGVTLTKSDYDRAQIKFALGTWDYKTYGGTRESPVHVNTTDESTFVDFSKDKSTIAYGELTIHKDGYCLNGSEKVTSTSWEWAEYTIPLDYNTLEVMPTHLIISCASSQYGDYFTGCSTSRLWIDAAELVY